MADHRKTVKAFAAGFPVEIVVKLINTFRHSYRFTGRAFDRFVGRFFPEISTDNVSHLIIIWPVKTYGPA